MSTPKQSITVSRAYRHEQDACVRALQVLLDQSVLKMANKPALEPVGRNDGIKVKGDSANVILPE